MFGLGSTERRSAGTRRSRFALTFVLIVAAAAALAGSRSSPAAGRAVSSVTTPTARVAGTWGSLPTSPVAPDFDSATSVWTGTQMLVFGRDVLTAPDAHGNPYAVKTVNIAAAYDPATRTWRRLAPPLGPTSPGRDTAVWTGKEMLVWGANLAYNPATNHWRRLPKAPAGGGLVLWTGHEMIGWGGGCCGDANSDGAAYNPATNKWRKLARSPLAGSQHPIGAWTGRELVILVGNLDPDGKPWPARLARAAAYNPATGTWRRVAQLPASRGGASAVWDGRELLVLGGETSHRSSGGFAYNPKTNRWRRLPAVESGRTGALALWTGKRALLWGGQTGNSGRRLRNGLAYDPKANRWSLLPSAPLPERLEPTAVWTGHALIVWGGVSTDTWGKFRASGGVFTTTP
jgi:hypothetical protein